MKPPVIFSLLFCVTLFSPVFSARALIYSNLTYNSDGSAVFITGYTGTAVSVIIPPSIDGLPVKSIGDNAFSFCFGLTNVIVPHSLTNIGNNAFDSCFNLPDIMIGSNVIYIGNNAFYACSSLTNVVIPDSVVDIGSSAFDSCSSLAGVTIGSHVASIGDYSLAKQFLFCKSAA